MSAAGEAQAKVDTHASGAKPRPEGRDRERGWRPTCKGHGSIGELAEAARRRAIEVARHDFVRIAAGCMEGE